LLLQQQRQIIQLYLKIHQKCLVLLQLIVKNFFFIKFQKKFFLANQFPSSSPLLDSNDLLTNTVNKVASGADISPTNLEEGTSTKTLMSSTSTSSTTSTNLPLTKPKQPKKKAPIKPKILVDEQRKNSVKIQPAVAVPCISPQIFGASPPQVFLNIFFLDF